MFHTWHAGADCVNPAGYIAIRATGDKAWFGWPNIPAVETEVDGLVRRAKDLAEEKAAIARLNKAAMEHVVYVPTGFLLRLPGLAQQRQRRRQGPAAVLLGRGEGLAASIGGACSPTSSGASWRRSRSWRSSRCSCSACSTSRRATRPRSSPATRRRRRTSRRSAASSASTGRSWSASANGPGASCTATSARRSSPTCRSPP